MLIIIIETNKNRRAEGFRWDSCNENKWEETKDVFKISKLYQPMINWSASDRSISTRISKRPKGV